MSKLRFYRCYNPLCADGDRPHDFWATEPKCDRCGSEHKSSQTEELTITHFDAGDNRVACDRNGPWRCSNKENMSGCPTAVTCPMCRATDAWKKADEEKGSGVGGISMESPAWKSYMASRGGQ